MTEKQHTRNLHKFFLISGGVCAGIVICELILWFFFIFHDVEKRGITSGIACFGDSFTYGIGADSMNGGYPEQLSVLLNQQVQNFGHPGSNSAQALQKIKEIISEHLFNTCIVLTGLNNMWNSEGFSTGNGFFYHFRLYRLIRLIVYNFFNVSGRSELIQKQKKSVWNFHAAENAEKKQENELCFLRDFLKLSHNDSLYKFYTLLPYVDNGGFQEIEKRMWNLSENTDEIQYLKYAVHLFRVLPEQTGFCDKYCTGNSSWAEMMKARVFRKQMNDEESYLLCEKAVYECSFTGMEKILFLFHVMQFMQAPAVSAEKVSDYINVCNKIFSEHSFLNVYFQSSILMMEGRYEDACRILDSARCLNEYREFENVRDARKVFEEKDYMKAVKMYSELLYVSRPDSFCFDYIRRLYATGKEDEAVQILSFFFINSFHDARLWATVGHIFSEEHDYDSASRAFLVSFGKNDKNAEVYLLYSYYLEDINKPEKSYEALEAAFFADPFNQDTAALLVEKSISMNENKKAAQYMRAYEKIADKGPQFLMCKAEFYAMNGRNDEALELCLQADTDDVLLIQRKGKLLRKLGETEAAIQFLEKVCDSGLNQEASLELVDILYKNRRFSQAISYLEEFFNKTFNAQYVYLAGSILREQQDEQAGDFFREACRLSPLNEKYAYDYITQMLKERKTVDWSVTEPFDSLQIQALKLYNMKSHKEAVSRASELITGKDTKAALTAAWFLYQTQRDELEILIPFADILKKNADFNYLKALVYYDKRDFKSAVECCLKSIEINPLYYRAFDFLGRMYLRTDKRKAYEYFQKAFLISYDFREFYFNIRFCVEEDKIGQIISFAAEKIEENQIIHEKKYVVSAQKLLSEDVPFQQLTGDLFSIGQMCKQNNVKCFLMTYPFFHPVNQVIRQCSNDYGLALIDLEKKFSSADSSYFVTDGHCSSKGYRLISEIIQETLDAYR